MPQRKRIQLPSDTPTPKVPVYLGSPNLEGLHITWRFSSADITGPFSCGQLTHYDFKNFWNRIRAFERMNSAQLKADGSNHEVPITNISRGAKARLKARKLDDVTAVYSFRIMGACRLWCMRHENILSVLWWDPSHGVYPVGKRNT